MAKLRPVMSGKLLEIYSYLDIDYINYYWQYKAAVTDFFGLTTDYYRRQFRESKKAVGETYREWTRRVEISLKKWLEKEEIKADKNDTYHLFLKEQLVSKLESEERAWILDKKPKTSEDIGKWLDEYNINRQERTRE